MKEFIAPRDMPDHEIEQLGIDMTMSILFNALLELPSEQIKTLLEESRKREVAMRSSTLSQTQADDIIKSMMYHTMSMTAMSNLLSELARYKAQRTQDKPDVKA